MVRCVTTELTQVTAIMVPKELKARALEGFIDLGFDTECPPGGALLSTPRSPGDCCPPLDKKERSRRTSLLTSQGVAFGIRRVMFVT